MWWGVPDCLGRLHGCGRSLLSPVAAHSTVPGLHADQRPTRDRIHAGRLCQDAGRLPVEWGTHRTESSKPSVGCSCPSPPHCRGMGGDWGPWIPGEGAFSGPPLFPIEIHRAHEEDPHHHPVHHIQRCQVHRCFQQGVLLRRTKKGRGYLPFRAMGLWDRQPSTLCHPSSPLFLLPVSTTSPGSCLSSASYP